MQKPDTLYPPRTKTNGNPEIRYLKAQGAACGRQVEDPLISGLACPDFGLGRRV